MSNLTVINDFDKIPHGDSCYHCGDKKTKRNECPFLGESKAYKDSMGLTRNNYFCTKFNNHPLPKEYEDAYNRNLRRIIKCCGVNI